jgi:hypothetical protein
MRPRDFALLLLASGEVAPRRRARDQQADRAGLALKRRILEALADRDPEADELEGTLLAVVEELGPPTGPTRAVAVSVYEEWRAALAAPEWVGHLLAEGARRQTDRETGRQGDRETKPGR